ncbi:MAG: IS1634 family transposase, partial [Acidimicrobiia bacterium]
RPDFLYVADCKLATRENMQYLHNRGGRFVTILPRSRREDALFRERLLVEGDAIAWEHLYDVTNEEDEVVDRLRVCCDEGVSEEGFRVLWYHSTRKVDRDRTSRARAIQRTEQELVKLRERLQLPRTRFRDSPKVRKAVDEILEKRGTSGWVQVEIHEQQEESFKQATPGRPGSNTQYVREVASRYSLSISIDQQQLSRDEQTDGVFPLISNIPELSPEELLRAYKRQPLIEKRFSQFKTDFEVAPVYLKEVSRIQSLLCVYFFVLLVQTLLERELRSAMSEAELESLPLYPERRNCRAPTTRRVLDLFEPVQRHELRADGESDLFFTELTPLQRKIASLLGINPRTYGR